MILNGMTEREWLQTPTERALVMLDGSANSIKSMLVDIFPDYCDSGLYTPKLVLLDHVEVHHRKFGTLWVIDSSLYHCFHVHIKQFHRTTLLRQQTRMMEAVNVL